MDKTIHGRPLEKNTIPSFQLVIIETLTESEHALFYHSATSVGEGKKEMFYLTMHSTHFIYGYMASDMVKDHSDSEKGNPLPPHGLLFSINSKGSFI